jgi:gamma-glutamyltranspeptidase / glutathione hydrolase
MLMAKGMVVAPQPEAVEAGAAVLRNGGNAVDAAVGCALMQTVVDPLMCGIAGFGSLQVRMHDGRHECIDFHGKVPAKASPDMWLDRLEGEARDGFGFVLRGRVNDVGYQSITVPGSLKAYCEALATFGTKSFAELAEPAARQAEEGVLVRPHTYQDWTLGVDPDRLNDITRVSQTAAARRIHCPNGTMLRVGETMHNPDMARTLRRIAASGPEIFYEGEIAREIADDMANNGGLLSAVDLADYRTTRHAPLWGEYRGIKVATNHPPGGGILLIEMLNILECFGLRELGHNSADYVGVLVEAMKRATIDKDRHVGDPNFVDVPVSRLTDKPYARGLADAIRRGEIAHVDRVEGPQEATHTTQVCVIDAAGNTVSMTHTLGAPSGVVTRGLGFMYNGAMGVFDPRPGRTGSIAPGKSRFSSICPSILLKDGQPYIVIGAPGGTQIAMGVLQVIVNVVDFGMSMQEAVLAPRFSATSDIIDISNRIPRSVQAELERRGYRVARNPLSYTFASVHGIKIEGGDLQGGADPVSDGMALAI